MKIDCSNTVNYLKEKARMTNKCGIRCGNCPISSDNNKMSINCTEFQYEYPEQAIEIVQKWSDEHPVKTRLEDLKEKYPDADTDVVASNLCVVGLGYPVTKGCAQMKCKECWNMPI